MLDHESAVKFYRTSAVEYMLDGVVNLAFNKEIGDSKWKRRDKQ